MNKQRKTKNPDAFLDLGYPPGYSFCEKLLSSGEFTSEFLKQFKVFTASDSKDKSGYASNVAKALIEKQLDPKVFLLEYVKRPRRWLSFKQGSYAQLPELEEPEQLLFSFGKETWYGPIKDLDNSKIWYIRTYKVPHKTFDRFSPNHESDQSVSQILQTKYVRWVVVAEVTKKYLALTWDGFSHSEDENPHSRNQFSFWSVIPETFKEIEKHIGGKWEHPELHILLLHSLWNKFIDHPNYSWSHKRVRAHSSGIALNAHSSSDAQVDMEEKGLKALSKKITEAALDSLGYAYPHDETKFSQVEKAVLNTLIREWGTKSYEFTLKKYEDLSLKATEESSTIENGKAVNNGCLKTLFRVHCYFGLDENKSQDSLQHLKCYRECNSSRGALVFLLAELGIEETQWSNSLVNQN